MFVCVFRQISRIEKNFREKNIIFAKKTKLHEFLWCVCRRIEKNFREKKNKIREKDEFLRMFVCECLDEYSELRRIFANVCVWVLRRI